MQDRAAAGSDVSPVAAFIAGAKCDPPGQSEVEARVAELRNGFHVTEEGGWNGGFADFFRLCFHRDTLPQVLYLLVTGVDPGSEFLDDLLSAG